MGTVCRNLSMEIFIKDNIKKESFMVEGSIVGRMDLLMKVILFKEAVKGREIGNHQGKEEIYILEGIKMIKNVDMADIYGLMDAFIKVISKMT